MQQLGRFVLALGLVGAGCGLVVDGGQPGSDAATDSGTIHHPADGAYFDGEADHGVDHAGESMRKDGAGDSSDARSDDAVGDAGDATSDTATGDGDAGGEGDAGGGDAAGDGAAGADGAVGPGWLVNSALSGPAGIDRLVLDAKDSVLLGGAFNDPIDFGGGTLTPTPWEINDNFYATDAFLVMLENDGTFRWQLQLSGTTDSDSVDAVALAPDGNAIATGRFIGSITIGGSTYTNPLPPGFASGPGPGGSGAFVMKRSGATGAAIWSRGLTTTDGSVDPGYVTVAPDGTVVVSGTYVGTFDAGGGAFSCSGASARRFIAAYSGSDGAYLWSRCFDSSWSLGYIPTFDNAGDLLFVATLDGESVDFGAGPVTATACALVVAKYDGATGTLLYTRTVASSSAGSVAAYASSLLGGTDLAITGTVGNSADFGSSTLTAAGSTDVFVARVAGSDGSLVWSQMFGGVNRETPTAITEAGNAIHVGGRFEGSTSIGGQQFAGPHTYSNCVFLATLSPAGDITGASYLGPAGLYALSSLAPAPDGGLFLGGDVQGELDLTSGTVLTATNDNSLYAARLAP